jgi:AcrR family transcriptional regulator
MGRWMPDARGRMVAAALGLFAERGFEQTTAAEIAERAGVTERTFFRHFADKREVLFGGADLLEAETARLISVAPAYRGPLDAVVAAIAESFSVVELEHARRRAAVVASHPSLQERELLKMASLSASAAAALRERGVADPTASLAGESGVAVFKTAFEAWIAEGGTIADRMRDALAQLRAAVV